MARRFRVGVTRDLRGPDGRPILDIGLQALAAEPAIEWEFVPEEELDGAVLARYDALFLEVPRLSAAALDGVERLRLVARFFGPFRVPDNSLVNSYTTGAFEAVVLYTRYFGSSFTSRFRKLASTKGGMGKSW